MSYHFGRLTEMDETYDCDSQQVANSAFAELLIEVMEIA